MNYLIQRGKIRAQVINVPEGLPEILSDITREVLRCQPTTECLCEFIIDYLHSVIVTREKARMAKMIIDRALRIVDEIVADMCICDIHKTKADQMREAMEECFKRFLAQRRCEKNKNTEMIKFNEIDILDELIQKCKFSEDELKISRPIIEAAYQKFAEAYMTAQENTEGTEALYQYFREREMKRIEERIRQEAALKIQANFRGFLVRRSLFLTKEVEKPAEETAEVSEDLLQKEVAARKIQRFFRRKMSFMHKPTEITLGHDIELHAIGTPSESRVSLTFHPPANRNILEQSHNESENLAEKRIIPELEAQGEVQRSERLADEQTVGNEGHLEDGAEMIPESTTVIVELHQTDAVEVDAELVQTGD